MSKNGSKTFPVEQSSIQQPLVQKKPIQKSPIKEPPLVNLAVEIKEELYMISLYIRAKLPMLSHVIVHDVTITSHSSPLSFISKLGLNFYTPYKLLVILKSDYEGAAKDLELFSENLPSFYKQYSFLYPPSITFIGEKEFAASMKMDNSMIIDTVCRGRVIVDVEIEKDWIWND